MEVPRTKASMRPSVEIAGSIAESTLVSCVYCCAEPDGVDVLDRNRSSADPAITMTINAAAIWAKVNAPDKKANSQAWRASMVCRPTFQRGPWPAWGVTKGRNAWQT